VLFADELTRGPVDDRDIGGDVARDDGLTETPVRADDDLVASAATGSVVNITSADAIPR
jgi:hypothetical protein